MKSGRSLTPIPCDTNKAGSKVTRHEEPGRTKEAGSTVVPQQTSRPLSLQRDHVPDYDFEYTPQPANHLSPRSTVG